MEYLFIYLLQISDFIDKAKDGFFFFLIMSTIGFIVLVFLTGFQYEDHVKNDYLQINESVAEAATRFLKKIVITLSVLSVITALVPTKQTLLFVGGTYIGKKAVNTVVTDEKIKKVDEIINLELDKKIKELKGE